MNTMQFPPPPPPPADLLTEDRSHEEKAEFAGKLAGASLVMPLLLVAINFFTKLANNSTHTRAETMVRAVIFFTAIVAGVVLAIVALCRFRRGMGSRILVRAGAGLLLNGALIAVFATGFANGHRNSQVVRQNLSAMESAAGDVRQQVRRAVERGEEPAVDLSRIERVNQQVAASAAKLSGDDRAITYAGAALTERALSLAKSFESRVKALTDAEVFSSASVTNRDIFQHRRKVVEAFIASARQYVDFQNGIEKSYREELQKQGLGPEAAERAVTGFRRGLDARNRVIIGVREADVEMGNAMLGYLDLLDTRWGRWTYAQADETVTFDSGADLELYQKYLDDFGTAARRQLAFQKQVAKVIN